MDNQTPLSEADARLLERCRHYELDAEKLDRMAEICERQHQKIRELKGVVAEQGGKLTRTETELRDALGRLRDEAALRPSLEVLQRMANGLDPFDRGRFQCAVAALPHETPKLSATVSHNTNNINWGPLDPVRIAEGHAKTLEYQERKRQERIEASGWSVIEGEGA